MKVLIFSGSNDRAVISFCRYSVDREIPIYIIANGNSDYIFDTIYKEHVIAVRSKNILDISILLEYCESIKSDKSETVLIVPSTEYLNRFLLQNCEILAKNNVEIGLCDREVYEKISDKYLFNEICIKEGINVPNEYLSVPDFYPFVVKPKKYITDSKALLEKPLLVYNRNDFEKYIKNKDLSDYYYQEYITGQSFYLLYYFFKSGEYSVYSQENLMQQENGGSMILCKSSTIHSNVISKKFADLFVGLGFSGLVMVEVKLQDDKFYMIEANPRLWGPSQLILNASMNLFDCFAFENKLISEIEEVQYEENQWYFWAGGLIENQQAKKNISYYNFNSEMFFENYNGFLNNEVYLKKDTINLYLKENIYE
ncbi:ATP-grasp domain-containing protein [Flavobacterium sp. 245]|uniref:ATP-grasp domain-containing protein n=1 Tax=Flavobacterium sp. 245 TaxID=2512115 RepID=UPI00105DD04C|nr:ATP-grasp domain-containing protein [Flavobacterium sp. 245]TDP00885.1 hypothetical protein EV145_105267 [Flavobacterium sp. 245]